MACYQCIMFHTYISCSDRGIQPFVKMETIGQDFLEELMTFNNQMNCVQETIGSIQNSDLFVITNTENGRSTNELIDPFQRLFTIATKRPFCDVQYVRQRKPDLNINIGENCNDLNVFDLETFLQAIVPRQTLLIQLLEDQCNIFPEYQHLLEKVHLINTPCSRVCCQGRILAGSKFFVNGNSEIPFSIAHPPFVYELVKLMKYENETDIKSYLTHLSDYLANTIETDSCLLCLTYDLYCTDTSDLNNFRLFFLDSHRPFKIDNTPECLYEQRIEEQDNTEQCDLFDILLTRVSIMENDESYMVQYFDGKNVNVFC